MQLKHLSSLAIVAGALMGATLPAWSAGPAITFTLDGKPVTSVPVDRLGDVTFTVNTGGQNFKQIYSGQWGNSIDQALSVFGDYYPRSGPAPSLDKSASWPSYDLALSSGDSNWANKTSLSVSMGDAAKASGLKLFNADNNHDVVVTTRFYRKVYTGKTVWKDDGWVQETRWETVGPTLGQATLKLEPPTFASSLSLSSLFAPALEKFNAPPENKYNNNRAMEFSRWLLYPTSYGGREVNFEGSKITGFELAQGGQTSYNWNYEHNSGAPMVYARFPLTMKIHSVMNTKYDGVPIPMKTEADFVCPVEASASRMLSGSSWEASDLGGDKIAETCRTPDGKTAADVLKSANPLDNNPLKGLGF